MHYQLLRDGFHKWKEVDIDCAVCSRPAQHRLLVPANMHVSHSPDHAVPPERRGLCRECGRGRHSFTYLTDEEIKRLRGRSSN